MVGCGEMRRTDGVCEGGDGRDGIEYKGGNNI